MRTIASLLCFFSLLLTGCESMPTAMRDRFSPVPPKVRAYEGDLRTVFTGAQLALKRLDFTLTDSSGAPVKLEASSRIRTSASLGDSRQTIVNLHLRETHGGKTEVEAVISIQVENANSGAVSAVEKREDVFYETFFATLEQVLQEMHKERR